MTYPLIGNYGRLARRRPVDPAVAARPRRGQRDRRGARRRPPARRAPARQRRSRPSPASTRARSPATCAPTAACAAIVTAARRDRTATRQSAAPGPSPRWEDQDFVGQVSPAGGHRDRDGRRGRPARSAIVDLGLKANIVRSDAPSRRAGPRLAPHGRRAADVLARRHRRASILSPGPGDPARLDGPVALARAIIDDGRPLLGICLGHQIVGRAAGAETTRLRFGHHGANHPVQDLELGLVQVTAQNHEVQVVGDSLPRRIRASASAR